MEEGVNKTFHPTPPLFVLTPSLKTDVYIIFGWYNYIYISVADARHVMWILMKIFWWNSPSIYLFEFSLFSCAGAGAVIQEISSCISFNCTLEVLYCTYWLIKSSTIKFKLILFLNNSSPPLSWSKYRMKPVALVDNYSINVRNTVRVKVLMFSPEHISLLLLSTR